jgi:hypothetical protein
MQAKMCADIIRTAFGQTSLLKQPNIQQIPQ